MTILPSHPPQTTGVTVTGIDPSVSQGTQSDTPAQSGTFAPGQSPVPAAGSVTAAPEHPSQSQGQPSGGTLNNFKSVYCKSNDI